MKLTLHGILVSLAALIVAFVALRFALDPGYTFNQTYGGASISIHAPRITVFAVGDCIEVNWRAEGISEIYFNDVATVGDSQQTACTTDHRVPSLSITFPDGLTQQYVIPIRYWIEQPETWAMVIAAVALLVGGVVVAPINRLSRRIASGSGEVIPTRRDVIAGRFLKGFGLLTLILLLTATLLEVGMRFYFSNYGTLDQKISYIYNSDEIHASVVSSMILLPNVGYSMSPFYEGINDLGYRGEDIVVPKPEGTYRILIIGSSEVYGLTQPNLTFPAQLQRILREDYGYANVEVVNGGVLGYTSWNTFSNFALRGLELDPDFIIVYINGNDVDRRTVSPDCYRGVNVLRGLDPSARIPTDPSTKPLSPLVLVRFLTINLGIEERPTETEQSTIVIDTGCDRDGGGTPAENVAANPPIYFRRNIKNIVGIAQIYNIQMLISTYAYWQGTDEAEQFWRDAVAEQNIMLEEVAAETGTYFFDYAAVAPQERAMWGDYVHANGDGLGVQAERFADYLNELDIIPK